MQAHETGLPDGTWPEWRDVAVLVRSKRLLGPLREALEQRGVPVEVVGLSGLLETPEIVDLVSTPAGGRRPRGQRGPGPAAPRPRWRIVPPPRPPGPLGGPEQLGPQGRAAGEDPDPGDVSFALAEALDHLDEVEGLDEEARRRLDAFREELRELRAAARGPLLDLVQTILERTGVWAELEASGTAGRSPPGRTWPPSSTAWPRSPRSRATRPWPRSWSTWTRSRTPPSRSRRCSRPRPTSVKS